MARDHSYTDDAGKAWRPDRYHTGGQLAVHITHITVSHTDALSAIDKTFHNLEPDAEGKLILTFAPVRVYASVNAIEVVHESEQRGDVSAISSNLVLHFCGSPQERKVISFMGKRKCESQRVQEQANAIASRRLFKNVTRGVSAVRRA